MELKTDKEHRGAWTVTKEKILMFSGLLLIGGEFVNGEILGRTFHGEFLLAGAALCGVSIASWGDKKAK
jgi:hypothetical protein